MKLDPLSLRLFVRVVEDGTIASVAAREHIASAAISRRLSELEDALGTQLLVRTNKGLHSRIPLPRFINRTAVPNRATAAPIINENATQISTSDTPRKP